PNRLHAEPSLASPSSPPHVQSPVHRFILDVMAANMAASGLLPDGQPISISQLFLKIHQLEAQCAGYQQELKESYAQRTLTLYSLKETAMMATYCHPSNRGIAEETIQQANEGLQQVRESIRRHFPSDPLSFNLVASDTDSSGRSTPIDMDDDKENDSCHS
ncbi:hypothetical protein PENTCL1PPCAC_29119, partial [Pristionchus entomophagus]